MTSDQARAARTLLGWEPAEFARASGVPLTSILTFERIGLADPAEISQIKSALEQAGVDFATVWSNGVRVRKIPD